jgi:superfamily II DNA or RNA helicase
MGIRPVEAGPDREARVGPGRDRRGLPFKSTHTGFGVRNSATCQCPRARYLWKGAVLGGRDGGPKPEGLSWIKAELAAGRNLIAMCMEYAPGDCHRHCWIGLPLAKQGFTVRHIFEDELIEPVELQRSMDASVKRPSSGKDNTGALVRTRVEINLSAPENDVSHAPFRDGVQMSDQRIVADHQEIAIARLGHWWRSRASGLNRGFIAMPTGSGKTFTAVRFIVDEILAKKKAPGIVWVAHNDFLLEQARSEFARQLDDAGLKDVISMSRVSGSGDGADANVVLATIQTLARGKAMKLINRAGDLHLVVFDEFHRLAADTWWKVPGQFQRGVRMLGLSATPFRRTAERTDLLREILPHRIFSVGITELIRSQFLADPQLRRVNTSCGEIQLSAAELRSLAQFHQLPQSALNKIATQAGRDQLIVDTYKEGRKNFQGTLVFCCSVAHAEALASLFRAHGISSRSICGSSTDLVNRESVEAFRCKQFEVATSVILLTEGVDLPSCRTVFFARPTESPILMSQMMGRAMRGPSAGGSATCHVVDFVDNFRNGLDLSASHFGNVRDHDVRFKHLIHRQPKRQDEGVSVALLLRIQEFINARLLTAGGAQNLGRILQEEVAGWFERWDGEMLRLLLVPQDHAEKIYDALEEASREKPRDLARLSQTASEAEVADRARGIYDSLELEGLGVSEEDFVGIASHTAKNGGSLNFHALSGSESIQDDSRRSDSATAALDQVEADLKPTGARDDFREALSALRSAIRPLALRRRAG